MERIIDKTIIGICCLAVLFITPPTVSFIVGMLLAVCISALQEATLLPRKVLAGGLYAYLAAALMFPAFALFVPLIAYDCMQRRNLALKLAWLIPVLALTRSFDTSVLFFLIVASSVACALSWRTDRVEGERQSYMRLRDELRELSLSLGQKNQDLQEKQDYEVKLATLAERGRIAREIHDNVGHLLTRSVLQVEAAQVVHADDPQVRGDLEQVGKTVREAFETVRASVHDLHDDSFDLYTQLYAVAQDSVIEVDLEYQLDEVPDRVGYGLAAIAREAVANAAKHSDASRVKVSVAEYPAFWRLTVQDNGTRDPGLGEDRRDKAEGKGIGLKTMEERARSLGGIFRTDYDKGLRVFASIPKARGV